jgi:hypothetical protein
MRSHWERFAAALARHKILSIIGAVILLSAIVHFTDPNAASSGNHAAPTPTPTSTRSASASASHGASGKTATVVRQKPGFPPKTLSAFRAFAATGDASQIHEVKYQETGLPSCPEPQYIVAVSRAITGRALEADLSAFFMQHGLISDHCQAFVFAFHSRRDYKAHTDDGYTVGRVALTTNSASGSSLNLEVDVGNITRAPIDMKTQFDFNF